MPVKRRPTKARARYPEPIEQLIAGEVLEWSNENWHEMIGVFFFGDYDVPPDARARARALLDEWRDRQMEHEEKERGAR